jgi:chromosome segregation ATPase
MNKKHATIIGLVVLSSVTGIRAWTRHAAGFARAAGEAAVEQMKESIPDPIHDRKLDNEIDTVRQSIIDRQVQMNLSAREIEKLTAEVSALTASVSHRKQLLAEAYPVLKSAIDGQQTTVKFANEDYTLAEFQREIDDLLSMQDRETRQMEIKSAGLDRLRKSVDEGHAALSDMKNALEATEQEVAQLRTRRDQANVESLTLDLVSSATAQTDSIGAVIQDGVARLKSGVDTLEARNDARRAVGGTEVRTASRGLGRQWSRMESLKAIHDEAQQTTEAADAAVEPASSLDATNVIITVEGRNDLM